MYKRRAFTLVELLVVVGIIALLISILMPALSRSRRQAQLVACQSNMRQVGILLVMYANDNKGRIIPQGENGKYLGAGVDRPLRWPTKVFSPPVWNPPVLNCPADLEPLEEHSFVLNVHLVKRQIFFGKTQGLSSSNVILMGEKKSTYPDYHMNPGQFDYLVEQYRHGVYVGSNYLFLDGHVATMLPAEAKLQLAVDPWDPVPPTPEPPPG